MPQEEIVLAPSEGNALVSSLADGDALVSKVPATPAERFAQANMLFRRGNVPQALTGYVSLLEETPSDAGLLCNAGICLRLLGRLDEAVTNLKKAIIRSPRLFLAHLNLAKAELARGDCATARVVLDRLLELDPAHTAGLLLRGDIALSAGMLDLAQAHFEQVLAHEPSSTTALSRLSEVWFNRGKEAFERADLATASACWSQALRHSGSSFHDNPNIALPFSKLIQEHAHRGDVSNELAVFRSSLATNTQDYYLLLLQFLFSVSLIPEVYEERENLASAEARWHQSLEIRGEHGYAYFRIAACRAYQGRLREALEQLRICQDKLPPKKQTSLKLSEFAAFIHQVEDIVAEHQVDAEGGVLSDQWMLCGFSTPFVARAWSRIGFGPDEAQAWRAEGFTPRAALHYRRQGFSPAQGGVWTKAGFSDPGQARKWLRAGVSPTVAAQWAAVFGDAADPAIQAYHAGFSDPRIALPWTQEFFSPWEAWDWFSQGFSLEEAGEWRSVGFSNAQQAERWRHKGMDPAEAAYAYAEQLQERPRSAVTETNDDPLEK